MHAIESDGTQELANDDRSKEAKEAATHTVRIREEVAPAKRKRHDEEVGGLRRRNSGSIRQNYPHREPQPERTAKAESPNKREHHETNIKQDTQNSR